MSKIADDYTKSNSPKNILCIQVNHITKKKINVPIPYTVFTCTYFCFTFISEHM